MPKRERDQAVQRFKQADGAMDRALYHLSQLRNMYGEGYEEYNRAVEIIMKAQLQVKEFLNDFRIHHI